MNYLIKILHIVLITSFLFSQETMRVSVDYRLSSIKVKDKTMQILFQSSLESALSQTIRETEKNKWSQKFEIVSQRNMDFIFEKQKEMEMLENCDGEDCSFELGKLVASKYIIYPEISETKNGYQISIYLLNIEKGIEDGEVFQFHALHEQDERFPKTVKVERIKIRTTLMVKKLFNDVFDEPVKLAGALQCKGITKKGAQCKRKEPNWVMYDQGYCYQHR